MDDKKNNEEDFFGDIFDRNEDENLEIPNEDTDFDFEDETFEEEIIPEVKSKELGDDYKRPKSEIQESVEELQGSINSMLDTINITPDDMFADKDLLPGLEIEIEHHDYEKDIELIKIDSKETLECLANLYLSDEQMKTKNIYKIIKDDSMALSKLNFSIECAQRALISCMKQLDMGVNDPDMYQSVALFQKEMRDTVKMAYDIQKKMKEFYKELKAELLEINAGEEDFEDESDNYTVVGDPKMLNDIFEQMKEDPTLLEEMMEKSKNKKKK